MLNVKLLDLISRVLSVCFGKTRSHWKGNLTRKIVGYVSMVDISHDFSKN